MEPLNHLKIYMKDGSQIRMMGVATKDGFDDETETCSDSEAGQRVSRSRKEKEVGDSRYSGAGNRVQPMLCRVAPAALGTKVLDEDRWTDGGVTGGSGEET